MRVAGMGDLTLKLNKQSCRMMNVEVQGFRT